MHTIRHLFEHRGMVLMYHRIADVVMDPWDLTVSPENFEQQIQLLTKNYKVISILELINHLQQKNLPANSVCITFDDGYTDNYLFAKPILEKYNCPATLFIPSQFIGQEHPFWWEELEAILLTAPQLPQLFQMSMQDDTFEFDLEADAVLTNEQLTKHRGWRWPASAPTRRCALYVTIWEQLKSLPFPEIEAAINEVKTWAGFQPVFSNTQLPMRKEQLAALAQHPLFDIGLHTDTHPALAYHTEDVQYFELAENKKKLQPYRPINAIAFPYGNYNNSTIAVLKKQRLDAGFTTEAKNITNNTNLHCIGRFQVRNANGTLFEKQLHQWLKA